MGGRTAARRVSSPDPLSGLARQSPMTAIAGQDGLRSGSNLTVHAIKEWAESPRENPDHPENAALAKSFEG